MGKKTDRIMKDLETLDASADGDRENMKKTIEKIIKSKPHTGFRNSFKKRLEGELLSRAKELSGEDDGLSRGKLFYFKKYGTAGSIAAVLIAAFIFLPLYLMQTGESEKQVATTVYRQKKMPAETLERTDRTMDKKIRSIKGEDKKTSGGLPAGTGKMIARGKSSPPPVSEITGLMKNKKSLPGDREDMSDGIGTGTVKETDDLSGYSIARAPMKGRKRELKSVEESEAIISIRDKKPGEKERTVYKVDEQKRTSENEFRDAGKTLLSTLSFDTGTSSYSKTRRFLTGNRLPPRNSVRIEEFINSFSYPYPAPRGDTPFSITAETGRCPWNGRNKLVHIGIKGPRPIAGDVKIEVEFNPSLVSSYRFMGNENRMPAKKDFNQHTGKPGPEHTVTALYEIVPARGKTGTIKGPDRSGKLMTVKLRYRKPGSTESSLIVKTVKDRDGVKLSNNFRFSAAVAEFGMLLRKSRSRGSSSYAQVKELAENSLGKDRSGHRREFLRLVRIAEVLDK